MAMFMPARINPLYRTALAAYEAGINVLPIRPDGSKMPALARWHVYQREMVSPDQIRQWFTGSSILGLGVITGGISGALLGLDFDDHNLFLAWREYVRSRRDLADLYQYVAEGYEERTPKNGRHILVRCPEAFRQERKPGSQKLALKPAPPPKNVETMAETRAEGALLIIYPSHGSVHPSGKPYYLLRGGVTQIRTITLAQLDLFLDSVRKFDQTPQKERPHHASLGASFVSTAGNAERSETPWAHFNRDPSVTLEALLAGAGWDVSVPRPNSRGFWACSLRHPHKVGPGPNATLNADGSGRLFCFSPTTGLPTYEYLNKFEVFAHLYYGGDFRAAARALREKGYGAKAKISGVHSMEPKGRA